MLVGDWAQKTKPWYEIGLETDDQRGYKAKHSEAYPLLGVYAMAVAVRVVGTFLNSSPTRFAGQTS
jgi:hypothetical protein